MKKVGKGPEPVSFADWKAKAHQDWQPAYADLQHPEKRDLHQALLDEQGGVCCYCGRAITLQDSHVEHFRPQEAYPQLALAYANLHASCIRVSEPDHPLHCGHAKARKFDDNRIISPQDADCELRFLYTQTGEIRPADEADRSAEYMIGLLRLDIGWLQNRRKAALQVFDADFLASASDAEIAMLAHSFRQPDPDGRLPSFGHVVARYAEQLL